MSAGFGIWVRLLFFRVGSYLYPDFQAPGILIFGLAMAGLLLTVYIIGQLSRRSGFHCEEFMQQLESYPRYRVNAWMNNGGDSSCYEKHVLVFTETVFVLADPWKVVQGSLFPGSFFVYNGQMKTGGFRPGKGWKSRSSRFSGAGDLWNFSEDFPLWALPGGDMVINRGDPRKRRTVCAAPLRLPNNS